MGKNVLIYESKLFPTAQIWSERLFSSYSFSSATSCLCSPIDALKSLKTSSYVWSLLWHFNASFLQSPCSLVPSTSPIQPFDISSVATATLPLQAVPLPPLYHLSSYWTLSQFPARPQGSFPVCSGAGGNLSRETNCLVAASCEHLAQLGVRSQVTPPETKCGHLHAHASTHNTHSCQCHHLPSTTMGHKVMWCKMINEQV